MRMRNYQRRPSQQKRCSVRCPQRTGLAAALSPGESAGTADATALSFSASRSIDADDFSGEWPVFCANDETGAHGILEHVVPFVGVALVATQEVIVKSWLPERREPLTSHSHAVGTGSEEGTIQVSLQSFDPLAQSDRARGPEADEKMDVIGHGHVATDTYTELRRSFTINDKRIMHRDAGKDALSPMGVEGHEENRRVESLEDQLEPRWLSFDHSPHRKCCSVRCPQRTSSRGWRRAARSAEDSGRYSPSRLAREFWRFA